MQQVILKIFPFIINPSKNIDGSAELPFYEQLGVIKIDQALREYAMSYQVEIVERKYPIIQLEASKSSIKDFLMIF